MSTVLLELVHVKMTNKQTSKRTYLEKLLAFCDHVTKALRGSHVLTQLLVVWLCSTFFAYEPVSKTKNGQQTK